MNGPQLIAFSMEKHWELFPWDQEHEGISTLTTVAQHNVGSPRLRHHTTKWNPSWQKEVKLSQFADDTIIYVDILKASTKKLLECIQQSCRIKINAPKSVACLYTNHEALERDIKESIPFTTAPNHKTPSIKPNQEVKDLNIENYKTLLTKLKNLNKWNCGVSPVDGGGH